MKVVEKICRSEATPDLRSNVGCCGLTPIPWTGLLRALLLSGWAPVLKGGERLQSTQEKCRLRGLILTMIFCSGMDCVSDPKKGGGCVVGENPIFFSSNGSEIILLNILINLLFTTKEMHYTFSFIKF